MAKFQVTPRSVVLTGLALVAGVVIFKSAAPAPSAGGLPVLDERLTAQLGQQLAALQQIQEVAEPPGDVVWDGVFEVSGFANVRSGAFELTGKTARLRYSLESSESEVSFLAVYVLADSPGSSSGIVIPDVITAGNGQGEKFIARPAGRYVLNVQSASGSWSIEVAESR